MWNRNAEWDVCMSVLKIKRKTKINLGITCKGKGSNPLEK
jgi:hypothetical protein